MTKELPEHIKEKIKEYVERFANAYHESGVPETLPDILEDLKRGSEGADKKIAYYMNRIFEAESNHLQKMDADALETNLEILKDFLKILETGDVNVLEYVRKQETATELVSLIQERMTLLDFVKEWSNILAQLSESQAKDAFSENDHNCAICRITDSCPIKDIKQRLEREAESMGDKPAIMVID